jgi:CIC family chloride channel protein
MAGIKPIVQRSLAATTRLLRNEHVMLSVLSVALGLSAGVAAVAFRKGISFVQELGFGFPGERVASLAADLPWWQLLAVPSLGGLIIGLFIHFTMPGRRPQGVAQVIEASALRGGRMSLLVGIKAALASAASIGVGASVGREGPVVHLGATIGSWIAQRLRLGRALSRTLLGCGVAAAVAASFNAPIAGTFFALEVVVGHYALSAFAPIVIASITGTMVSRAVFGAFPAFILPAHWTITSLWEFPAFALLGLVSAVAAMAFMASVMFAEDVVERTPVPTWMRPAIGGLAIGAIAMAFPQVLGVGYEATDQALSGLYPLWLLLALILLKTAATAISLASGFAGGVFSPSLFIGAMVGGSFGIVATEALPELSSGHGAYTMIGMGAVAGAVLGAPISTIIMIFELTADYELTIAVMVATVIASLVTQQVHVRSFFVWQLERRGLSVAGGQEAGLMRDAHVRQIVDPQADVIDAEAPISEARTRLNEASWGCLYVIDDKRRLVGTLSYSDLGEFAFDTSRDAEFSVGKLAQVNPKVLAEDDDLEAAIEQHLKEKEPHLPVVNSRDAMRFVGISHEHAVLAAYQQALKEARAEERGEF